MNEKVHDEPVPAAGVENCLRIRVSGTKGTLEWMQEFPQALTFKPLHGPSQNRTTNGLGTLPLSARSTRLVGGHPEGFPDGFANVYSDAAKAIAARRADKEVDPLTLYFPNSWDGLLGVRFVVSSNQATPTANGSNANDACLAPERASGRYKRSEDSTFVRT